MLHDVVPTENAEMPLSVPWLPGPVSTPTITSGPITPPETDPTENGEVLDISTSVSSGSSTGAGGARNADLPFGSRADKETARQTPKTPTTPQTVCAACLIRFSEAFANRLEPHDKSLPMPSIAHCALRFKHPPPTRTCLANTIRNLRYSSVTACFRPFGWPPSSSFRGPESVLFEASFWDSETGYGYRKGALHGG